LEGIGASDCRSRYTSLLTKTQASKKNCSCNSLKEVLQNTASSLKSVNSGKSAQTSLVISFNNSSSASVGVLSKIALMVNVCLSAPIVMALILGVMIPNKALFTDSI